MTDKENPGAHFNLANMLVDYYRDYNTAQSHFERAIALEPTYALYRMTFAEFLWHDLTLYELAAAQYEELIEHDESRQNEDVHFNYGLLLRDHLGNIDKALSQFGKALEINPNDGDAKAEYDYTVQLKQEEEDEMEPEPQPIGDRVVDKILTLKMDAVQSPQGTESKQSEHHQSPTEKSQISPKSKRAALDRRGSFRRSQHEIALGRLMVDEDEDTNYALLYHQTLDEKGKLQMLLDQKQSRERAMTDNLHRIKEMLNGNDFRNELAMMAANGVHYVESHAKEAVRILAICSKIVNELLSGLL